MIGGVVLPVWDKLPTENVRIYRVLTDEGDMLIGRVIPENLIDSTLKRMGANRTIEQIETTDLIQRIKQGSTVHLDNGWKIKQSRVSGEQRIEIVGPSYEHTDILKNKGVFIERISYVTRYFIPANTGTEKVIDEVLNISPVERVESSNINYSKDSDSEVMWGNDKKITQGMSDEDRYNILSDKKLTVTHYNSDLLKSIDGLNIESLNTKYKKEAKPILKKLAEEFGVFKEYSNEDIDLNFDYSRNSFSESVNKQSKEYLNFAKMLTVFDEVIKNAIGIEVHGDRYIGTSRADTKLLNTYVLISAFSDDNGIIPVKLLVKELRGEKNKLYLAVSTQKIEAGISAQTSGAKSTELKYAPPTSIISLSDFLKNVNPTDKDIIKYIPKQFIEGNSNVSKMINNNIGTFDKNNADIRYSLKSSEDSVKDWESDKSNSTAKPLHEIVSYLSDIFGVPISTGNLNYNKAQGQYKNFENSIRIKITNDLPNITHELGHLLDKKYNLREMSNIDEVLDFAEQNHPTLMQMYKGKDRLNEAVAEFVREYLKNPKKMKKEVPGFYDEFISVLSEEDTTALRQASKYIQDYFNSDFREKVAAATITNKEIKKTEKGSGITRAKRLYTKIVDDFAPINDVMEYVNRTTGFEHKGSSNAYTMAINSRNADAITSFILKVGMVDSNGNIIEGKSFIECIEDIEPQNIKDFDNYLILKHSIEWLEPKDGKVKRVFADDTLQDVERIKEEIYAYEAEHPEYITAANNLYEYQRNIQMWVVDTGGMGKELFKELQERYPNYVPCNRTTY